MRNISNIYAVEILSEEAYKRLGSPNYNSVIPSLVKGGLRNTFSVFTDLILTEFLEDYFPGEYKIV